jgi:hypothetical protein
MPRRLIALLVFAGLLALDVPAASAGGDLVDLAAGAGRAWLVEPGGLRSFDTSSGAARRGPQRLGSSYPLSVAITGGAVWVAGVENGYASGSVTRVDERTGHARVVLRVRGSSAQAVAAGAGSVWVLIGSPAGNRIERLGLDGRLMRSWTLPHAGRIAADADGCWVSGGGRLLLISPAGRMRAIARAPLGDVATGGGFAWLPRRTSVLRIDQRSGAVRTLATGRLWLGGFQHDLAYGDGSLWALRQPPFHEGRSVLVRLDPQTGTTTATTRVTGVADAVVAEPGRIWVAAVLPPSAGQPGGYALLRFDPRTLRLERRTRVLT